MALTFSLVQPRAMFFRGQQLRCVIIVEAHRGYQKALGGKMRLNSFLLSSAPKFSRSKHKLAETIVEKVNNAVVRRYGWRKLLKKVSALPDYDSFHDSIENGRAPEKSDIELKDAIDHYDVIMACKRFPSISLGSCPPVALYEEMISCSETSNLSAALSFNEFPPNSLGVAKCVDSDSFSEMWPSQYPVLPNVNSSPSIEEGSCTLPISPDSMSSKTEGKSDCSVMVEESSTEVQLKTELENVSLDLLLDSPIDCISGLSKKQCLQLESCGFHTLRKLLHHFPRTYADMQNAQIGIEDGQYLISVGLILSSRGVKASNSFSFLEVVVGCEIADNDLTSEHLIENVQSREKKRIYLHLKKFFRGTRFTYRPFLQAIAKKHEVGQTVCVSGKVKSLRTKDHYEIREYNIDVLKDEDDSSISAQGKLCPIHPSKGGLSPNFLKDAIASALQTIPANIDPVPEDITKDFGLLGLHDAYIGIHQPKSMNEADLARKRFLFDEFLYLQLGRLFQMLEGFATQIEKDEFLDRYRKPELNASHIEEWSHLTKKLLEALPYSLTSSQLSAVSEIIWDLKRPVPMNRLLQGDVGCGKTVVALMACMEVVGSGYQAAFMVPTELLAIQHYDLLLNLLEKMAVPCKPSVALLTGSTPLKQARMIRKDLQDGEISLVIGTHSLISENVEFSALRLTVVDEQHRFGVIQRGMFNSKLYCTSSSSRIEADVSDVSSKNELQMAPHVLAMSATPIPRTLALALYGDMSITQITGLPPGRIPVETSIIEGNDSGYDEVYKMMLMELEEGGKVYIVYPVIEQSEQLPQLRAASADLEAMSRRFKGYRCGLIHGKMKGVEKDEALKLFRSGETHILLATQVIEVGVDVPDASMMVVMNAERFGIAQLHQLRGRVGRGTRRSKCVLISATSNSLSRLKVLRNSSDGFHLANMDLLLRGPGDLLGKKQSGHLPEFPISKLEMDGNLLNEAHLAALKILGSSHDLELYPKLKGELSMRQPLSFLGD